jgi:short-subunit dehydrogenase
MKNVIITGAGRGIGFELAQIFAENNYNVLAISRNVSKIELLNNNKITALSVDLSKPNSFVEIEKYVSKNWSGVTYLINNAGTLINKPFKQLNTKDFLDVYSINVFAVAELIRVMLPYLSKGSHVVNISSIGGVQGTIKFPGLAAYSSSKGALITLTEMLAEEFKNDGIIFNVLALGAVQTEMLQEAFPGYKALTSAKEMAEYIYDFAVNRKNLFQGKLIQVSATTP